MPISSQALILIIYPNKTQERRDNVITKRKQGWFVKLSNGYMNGIEEGSETIESDSGNRSK